MNDIILKYLQGNASEKEKELLLVWLRADEENKKTFSEIRDRWLESDAAPVSDPELVKRAFKRFTTGIEAKERAPVLLYESSRFCRHTAGLLVRWLFYRTKSVV
jgi:hypothetical protein